MKICEGLCTLLPKSILLLTTSSSTMIVVLAMDFEGNLLWSSDDVTSKGWCSKDEVSPVEGGEPGTNVISLDSSGFMVTVNVGISNAGICKWKMAEDML